MGEGIMIKLICLKCGSNWYTANTRPNQKCGNCNTRLIEVEFIPVNEDKLNKNKKPLTL